MKASLTIVDFMPLMLVLVYAKLENIVRFKHYFLRNIVDYLFAMINFILHIGFGAGVDYPNSG